MVPLFALTLAAGCGYKSKMENMETQVVGLQAQVVQLESDVHDTCALLGETMTGGLLVYLGDDYWYNRLSEQTKQTTQLTELCLETLSKYRDALNERKDALESAKAAAAEELEPPVQAE